MALILRLTTKLVILITALLIQCNYLTAFAPRANIVRHMQRNSISQSRLVRRGATSSQNAPQIFSSGYSTNADLVQALRQAFTNAIKDCLPAMKKQSKVIDFCLVSVSSLYDGGAFSPALVVTPTLLEIARDDFGFQLTNIIGSSVAGCISSSSSSISDATSSSNEQSLTACTPRELEGIPSVSVTLAMLPDVQISTFACDHVPDDMRELDSWKRSVGLDKVVVGDDQAVVWLIPSPAFATDLPDLLQALQNALPSSSGQAPNILGGMASTVSSLSRAKLYYKTANASGGECRTDGCVGVVMQGDLTVQTLVAQGAKPVGGIYQILKGQDSTIQIIVLDEVATERLKEETEDSDEDDDDEEEEVDPNDRRAVQAQAYRQAIVPKPILAEANFVMRTLSDDDQAFMRRQLLVGLEQGGSMGRTASELQRLAQGQGHGFTVHTVASGGMKDGSVTLPLGSVSITPGTRLRFFVREPEFAKKEIDALWVGYKKRQLSAQFDSTASEQKSEPSACLVLPTLDRGAKFFAGKSGYESNAVLRILPGVPCITGYFTNGIVGRMDIDNDQVGVQGSASSYTLFSSKSGRPVYNPKMIVQDDDVSDDESSNDGDDVDEEEIGMVQQFYGDSSELPIKAPRTDNGELVLKRREVHSGRAMTVSTVEWSVAEKMATPTSLLEGFMWDKETEVDRQRERVPLSNLVSQCRLSAVDPEMPKPRAFASQVKQAAERGFVIIPECKKTDPVSGTLRKRYDVEKIAADLTRKGAVAVCVNCDAVLYGGMLDDVTKARQAASSAALEQISEEGVVAPPILASDLILYPYQLYKLRLAGADAVKLIGASLANKDLLYLVKIASSLQLQTLITVTSEAQVEALKALPVNSFDGIVVSNLNLEDFSYDKTGKQAINILKSTSMKEVVEKHVNLLVLAEGCVGLIGEQDESASSAYIQELQKAGAVGAVVGRALAVKEMSLLL